MPCGEEAFWAKVNRRGRLMPGMKTRCHEWTAYTNRKGYGTLKVGGRRGKLWLAHRFARYLATGKIPKKCVLHRCDNSACVRNSHLFDGTKAQNNADMMRKGRFRYVLPDVRGEKHGNARFKDTEIARMRKVFKAGGVTQAELASRFGCSRPYVSRLVRAIRRKAA